MEELMGPYVLSCPKITFVRGTDTCLDGNIELQKEDIDQLGKSTEGLLHAGGNDPERGYVANLEVFHYLHCLVSYFISTII